MYANMYKQHVKKFTTVTMYSKHVVVDISFKEYSSSSISPSLNTL